MKGLWQRLVGWVLGLFADRRRFASKARELEKTNGSARHDAFAQSVIALRGRCAACGAAEHLQTHHIVPGLALEFDRSNVMVLCMGPDECHLRLGHGGVWAKRNPVIVLDAAESLRYPDRRPAIRQRAALAAVKE